MKRAIIVISLFVGACGGLEVESTESGIAGGTLFSANGAWGAIGRIGGCAATLISEYAVLTAAHCIGTNGERRTFSVDGRGSADGTAIVHPKYCETCSRGWMVYDYAMIKLDQSIYDNPNFDSTGLSPMPVYRDDLAAGRTAYFYGFGNYGTDANGEPTCSEWDGQGRYAVATLSEFDEDWNYVFRSDRVSACNGDSGGPLLIYENDAWYVAGVFSWFELSDDLTVYKPTYMIADWIAENSGAPDNPGNTWGYCVYYQDGADGAYLSTQHGAYSTMPTGWSNTISSVWVKKGNRVSLYDGTGYSTLLATLDGFNGSNCNQYGCLHELAGTALDNRVSSVNCQSQLPTSTWGHCVYYDRFGDGGYLSVQSDFPSFTGSYSYYDNRISQIWVKRGYTATVYPRANYQLNGTHFGAFPFSGNGGTNASCNSYGCLHDLTGSFSENTGSSITCQ